jgi:hypothetical protein
MVLDYRLSKYPKATLESTVRRFPIALSAWRSGHATVVIAQVALRQGGRGVYASAIDKALMSIPA